MQIKSLGANQVEIQTNSATVLYSYSTPVAAFVLERNGYIRTNEFWSVTTSRHINQWLRDQIGNRNLDVELVDQKELDNLM